MANDLPDWGRLSLSPARLITRLTVAANFGNTVGPFTLPQGTHAVKIYISPQANPWEGAEALSIVDPTTGLAVVTWSNLRARIVAAAIDDISLPQIMVSISAGSNNAVTITVVAFLSDQAVFADNDSGAPLPTVPGAMARTVVAGGSQSANGGIILNIPPDSQFRGTVSLAAFQSGGAGIGFAQVLLTGLNAIPAAGTALATLYLPATGTDSVTVPDVTVDNGGGYATLQLSVSGAAVGATAVATGVIL